MRFYEFQAAELLDEQNPNFNLLIDPKCNWALNNYGFFPVEINTANYETLLRVPGLGVISVRKIIKARRMGTLDFTDLKKMGVVLKRAQYFITCRGKAAVGLSLNPEAILRGLLSERSWELAESPMEQLSLFDEGKVLKEDMVKCLTGQI